MNLDKTKEQSLSLRRQYDLKIKEYAKIERQLQHELEEIQQREAEKSKYIQHRKLELAAQHRKAATRQVEIFESRTSPLEFSNDSLASHVQEPWQLRHRVINKTPNNLKSLTSNRAKSDEPTVHPSKTSPDSSIGLWTDTAWW